MFAPNIDVMPPLHHAAHVWLAEQENNLPLDGWVQAGGAARARVVGYSEPGTSTSPATERRGNVVVSYTTSSPIALDMDQDVGRVGSIMPVDSIVSQISEIRTLSGLTFEQLAFVMGVQRRSIHNWMAGGNVKPSHRQQIGSVLAALRHIDRGSARENVNMLLSPLVGGSIGLDLLREGRFDDLMRVAGKGAGRPEPKRVDRSRTPLRGEESGGWLASVVRSSGESAADATLVRGRETRRVPFPKR